MTAKKADKPTVYPMGGMGLKDKEEEKLRAILIQKDISLKWLQRKLMRMYLNGEVVVEIDK